MDGDTYDVATLVSSDLLCGDSVPSIVVADDIQKAVVSELVHDLIGGELRAEEDEVWAAAPDEACTSRPIRCWCRTTRGAGSDARI